VESIPAAVDDTKAALQLPGDGAAPSPPLDDPPVDEVAEVPVEVPFDPDPDPEEPPVEPLPEDEVLPVELLPLAVPDPESVDVPPPDVAHAAATIPTNPPSPAMKPMRIVDRTR
jgi:hypothetical protein